MIKRRHPRLRRWLKKFRLSRSWRIRSSAARRNASSCSGTGKCAPQCSQTAAVQELRLLHQAHRFCATCPSGASKVLSVPSMPVLAEPGDSSPANADNDRRSDPKPAGDGPGSQSAVGDSATPTSACPQTPQKLASGALLAPQAAHICLASCPCSCITILLPLRLSTTKPLIDVFPLVAMNRLPSQRYQSGLSTRPVMSFG